jgi:uncharacterized protein
MSRAGAAARNRCALVIMAKAPRKGFVKTRLAGVSPQCDVLRLSECMLQDTLTLAQSLSQVHVAVMCPSGDVEDLRARLPSSVQIVGQDGRGLADALVSVFRFFAGDFRRVVALDSDSPHLPRATLESAFALLDASDLVVGPTQDGGYYLVGASAVHGRLFDAAPLGTPNACEALRGNAQALGLSVSLLDVCYDVDMPGDLLRLAGDLHERPERAPRTAAFLASWIAGARDETQDR